MTPWSVPAASPSVHLNPFPHPHKTDTILILQSKKLNNRAEFM